MLTHVTLLGWDRKSEELLFEGVFKSVVYLQPLVTLYFLVSLYLAAAHVGHLVLEEGEAVLTVPVVGLVLHPVEPGRVQMIVVMTVLMIETHTR